MSRTAERNGGESARAGDLAEAFRRDYLKYQYRFVEFFTEHVGELSRAFGGDLQSVIVLAIVGQMRLKAVRETLARGETPGPRLQGDGTTASRIADVTGIPRQTVRRKLLALRDKGWLEQDDAGVWRLVADPDGDGSAARRDLSEFDQRAMSRIARLVADLETFAER